MLAEQDVMTFYWTLFDAMNNIATRETTTRGEE
jgi:hypothetical protein